MSLYNAIKADALQAREARATASALLKARFGR